MKKGIKSLAIAALAVSALTPVAAASAAENVENGVYTSTEFYTLDAFKKLSTSKKAAALNSTGTVVVIGGQVFKASDVLTASDSQLPNLGTSADTYTTPAGNKLVSGKPLDTTAPVSELKVESVSAINSSQIKVQFSEAMDKATLIDPSGNLIGVTFAPVGTAEAVADATSTASLSADGKTLTITAPAGDFFNGLYTIDFATSIEVKDGSKALEAYSTTFTVNDTTAPSFTKVEQTGVNKYRVFFSEPLSAQGTYSFKYADTNTALALGDVTVTPTLTKGFVDLTITGATLPGKTITGTVIGALDGKGTVQAPNPATFTIKSANADGVAPKVQSIVAESKSKFTVKFSEQVDLAIADILVNGTALASGTASLVQDTTDKTKYTVTLNTALTNNINTIEVLKSVTDLSGEVLHPTTNYSQQVQFAADKVAPKLVSSTVKKDETDGKEYLHLVFDEKVTVSAISDASAKLVDKDGYTSTGTLAVAAGDIKTVGTAGKEVKIELAAVTFEGTALGSTNAGNKFTFNLTSVEDGVQNEIAPVTVSFTRGTDAGGAIAAQTVASVSKTSPTKVTVTFNEDVDVATANNVANYSIQGLTILKAEAQSSNKKQVVLTLKENENTLTGTRAITVKNVKSTLGKAMTSTYNNTIALDENVVPTFIAKQTTDTTITLSFSEDVIGDNAEDFEVFVNGVKATISSYAAGVITLSDAPAEGSTIKVKVVTDTSGSSDVIADTAGNSIKIGTEVTVK